MEFLLMSSAEFSTSIRPLRTSRHKTGSAIIITRTLHHHRHCHRRRRHHHHHGEYDDDKDGDGNHGLDVSVLLQTFSDASIGVLCRQLP